MGALAFLKVWGPAIVIGLLVMALGVQTARLSGTKDELAALKVRHKQAQTDLKDIGDRLTYCQNLNKALGEAHNACMKVIKVSTEAQAAASEALAFNLSEMRKTNDILSRQRETIWKLPSCKELGELDIVAMCPDLAGSLRERAKTLASP